MVDGRNTQVILGSNGRFGPHVAVLVSALFALMSFIIGLIGGLISAPMFAAISSVSSFTGLPAWLNGELKAFLATAAIGILVEAVVIFFIVKNARRRPVGPIRYGERWIVRLAIIGPVGGALTFLICLAIASYSVGPIVQ
jgi:hypothetical protein